ncbi:Putative transmembrane protein [Croceitalea dokdonensis DOKDO 023]|uniref:Putative transmembrane protein n=1 Tax=Croceitalea dokdonensis DOKDO 023 TaxID=1300341 RepID=A0A0P7A4G6_9FLAO|nr:hypothetical protein [Croceitalea dokdonensis]KPM31305.1 Putative transmembrane protein [Croceitalea dokdonensis DOKDO 023]
MDKVFTSVSYIFHPLFIPIAGTVSYFLVTPKYTSLSVQGGNILPIFILTVIIPILAFFILRNLGLISSIFAPTLKERKYPLYISLVLFFLILYKVIPQHYVHELYYFFIGLVVSTSTALLLLFFKMRISLHLLGMGNLLMFLIALSIHFEVNITFAIAIFTLTTGLVATSRLYMHAHSKPEVLVGLMVGIISQLVLLQYWL